MASREAAPEGWPPASNREYSPGDVEGTVPARSRRPLVAGGLAPLPITGGMVVREMGHTEDPTLTMLPLSCSRVIWSAVRLVGGRYLPWMAPKCRWPDTKVRDIAAPPLSRDGVDSKSDRLLTVPEKNTWA